MSNYSNELSMIELVSKRERILVVTNTNIDSIVFHPQEPVMFIRKDGKWVKVKYQAVE